MQLRLILMTSVEFMSTFLKHCIGFTFMIILNFPNDLNWLHVNPYAGKILNA